MRCEGSFSLTRNYESWRVFSTSPRPARPRISPTDRRSARTIRELEPTEVWITHGREEALKHIKACELNLVGYEDD